VPDTLYRVCPMSVKQAIETFGDACSPIIRGLYDRSQYEAPIEIYHAIEPDPQYDPMKFGAKPWRSVYWDPADRSDTLLRLSGYSEQPFWAPRWDVVGGDTYGVSPGMEALPSLRELQMQAKRRNEAIDQMVKPEKIAPPNVRLTGEPGRVVVATGVDRDQIFVPYQVPYQAVAAIGQEMDKCRAQIDSLAFADLFNAITNMAGIQPRTVEEIAARNEEKLTQLGPVIERVANEKLQVAIERGFGILQRGGFLPPVPAALSDRPINVEFVSILQQMQRMVGLGQIDFDEAVDEYGYRAGAPARLIRPEREVAALRKARAAQAATSQALAAMPAMKAGADAARLLAATDLGNGDSLLARLLPPG